MVKMAIQAIIEHITPRFFWISLRSQKIENEPALPGFTAFSMGFEESDVVVPRFNPGQEQDEGLNDEGLLHMFNYSSN